jgi:fatty-acyl-CoA synthase
VILEAGKEVAQQTILQHCETAFAKWQLPDEILFVDTIPLTSTGKMDKKVVRADLESKGYQLPSLRGEATG